MPDAEVIPIGGRGRPGRGSSTSPSAAARALAPNPPAARKQPRAAKVKAKATQPRPRRRPTPVAPPAPAEEAYRAEDIADAVRDAAHETFGGGGWEQQLAQFLAFVRRRLTGDYEVDEFGFDVDVTEKFLMTAVRPLLPTSRHTELKTSPTRSATQRTRRSAGLAGSSSSRRSWPSSGAA